MKTGAYPIKSIIILYLVLVFGVIVFYFANPFENKCISGDCSNGYGMYIFYSGLTYEGDWKNGKREGKGKIIYPDGAKYEGTFLLLDRGRIAPALVI